MATETDQAELDDQPAEDVPTRRSYARRAGKWLLGIAALLLALAAAVLLFLNTGPGKRFIVDQIADLGLESGLEIEIGRIEGSIYSDAVLHDISLSDPQGVFLTVPRAELDWRPLSWLSSGLDIRSLTARRGTLLRLPELNPGDPDAPLLPGFDIRIDRLELDDFTIAEGIAGDQAVSPVDLVAKVDIRGGRALVDAEGALGEADRFDLLLDALPDGNEFDLQLALQAPQGGAIDGLFGLGASYEAQIAGAGTWSEWNGTLNATRGGAAFADLALTANSGLYGFDGVVDPSGFLSGLPADALGRRLQIEGEGTFAERVLEGEIKLAGRAIRAEASGAIDLAENLVRGLDLQAVLTDPKLLGPDMTLEGARLTATADGALNDLTIQHDLRVDRFVSGDTRLADLRQQGRATWDGARLVLPFDATVQRVQTGNKLLDPRLVGGTLLGNLIYQGDRLTSDALRLNFPGLSARLALDGNIADSRYRLSGPVAANGLAFDDIGTVNAGADIDFSIDAAANWTLRAMVNGRVANVTNATLANLAGEPIRIGGAVSLGSAAPLVFDDLRLDAAKLQMALDGTITDGSTAIAGTGSHIQYGDFTVQATLADDGPRAELVFANPLPAAGLRDVRVALAPIEDGFRIDTEGGSTLGPFNGGFDLFAPADGPTRIAIDEFNVWETSLTGELVLADAGVEGALALAGGGLDGTIALSTRAGGQAFDVDIAANDASFGGDTPISVRRATIDASGLIVGDDSTIEGSAYAEGLRYGTLFLGRAAAQAEIRNGVGEATASIAGRRGSRFAMQMQATFDSERIAAIARGEVAGKSLTMPRRAVLTSLETGGYALAPTQVSYGDGDAVLSGRFGGDDLELDLQLSDMPLSLVDVVLADVGLGGTISGAVEFQDRAGELPTGSARVKIDNLTRSGLVLTSRPADVALSARLGSDQLGFRAVIDEGGERRGRLQGRIAGLPQSGSLAERMNAGNLEAQLRYGGPADALWRLAAIDAFDLTGPVNIAADVTGSLANPRVRGSLASSDLRVRSSLSGTDVGNVTARGTFSGSRLRLRRFTGTTPNGGTVSGSGVVDLEGLGQSIEGSNAFRGPQLDIRVAARNAELLDARGISATITGPLRIVSNGSGGTIAGRVAVDRASWALSTASADSELPDIPTREINIPADIAPRSASSAPWRYLIDARAPSRVDVDGLGLDSEWSADIILRGTTSDPRIGGEARMVRGSYSFAGTRFELERGIIDFDANAPIDPRLDIRAETEKDGLDVAVLVRGSALQPEISFTSTPALPEEELLARLLFGGSITELSATDALQLGAAVASLRGGGGMDPINQLRTAIGLDRLRIVGADPALDRGTGVALGKNIGKNFYVEIITDGRGYSATELEFRVTSWLSLLASVSTIGRESAVAEISKDY
ncbi:MAG: translocation/assembly module TamB domain-containing protein [Alteripontixanthobacter sp.]